MEVYTERDLRRMSGFSGLPCAFAYASGHVRPRQGTEICNFGEFVSGGGVLQWICFLFLQVSVQLSKEIDLKCGENSPISGQRKMRRNLSCLWLSWFFRSRECRIVVALRCFQKKNSRRLELSISNLKTVGTRSRQCRPKIPSRFAFPGARNPRICRMLQFGRIFPAIFRGLP